MAENSNGRHGWAQVAAVLVVSVVCVLIVRPLSFRIKRSGGGIGGHQMQTLIRLDFVSASVGGVLVLHFLDVVSLRAMCQSLLVVGRVQPWAVLVIFFTMAYASISLDVTGFSKYVALHVLAKVPRSASNVPAAAVNGRGVNGVHSANVVPLHQPTKKLLLVVYLLSGVVALVASNDVVVLTLTPVLLHFCALQQVDPRHVVMVEYVSANTWSAFLLVGNPTNIIVGQGASIGFLPYFLLLLVPTMVVVVATMCLLYWSSGGAATRLPSTASTNATSASDVRHDDRSLDDPKQQHSGASPPLCSESSRHSDSLGELPLLLPADSGSTDSRAAEHLSPTSQPIPSCTPAGSLAFIGIDVEAASPLNVPLDVQHAVTALQQDGAKAVTPDGQVNALLDPRGAIIRGAVLLFGVMTLIMSSYTPLPMYRVTSLTCSVLLLLDLSSERLLLPGVDTPRKPHDNCGTDDDRGSRPSTLMLQLQHAMKPDRFWGTVHHWWATSRCRQVCERMPWSVAPFAASMFILVDLLSTVGIAQLLSAALASGAARLGPFGVSVIGMIVTVVVMNVLNNQPATIMLVVVLLGAARPSTMPPDGAMGVTTMGAAASDTNVVLSPQNFTCLVLVVILGSNIAAAFTPKGALAGIMWGSILKHHGVAITFQEFGDMGLRMMLIPSLCGAVAVYGVSTFYLIALAE